MMMVFCKAGRFLAVLILLWYPGWGIGICPGKETELPEDALAPGCFRLDTEEVVWEIDIDQGSVTAWHPQTRQPLWSENGRVFQLNPEKVDRKNRIRFPDRECCRSVRGLNENSLTVHHPSENDSPAAPSLSADDLNFIDGAEVGSRFPAVILNDRLYVLLPDFQSGGQEDRKTDSFDTENPFPVALNADDPALNSGSGEGTSDSAISERISGNWLIALDVTKQGRLVWKIPSSALPFSQARFLSVPFIHSAEDDSLMIFFESQQNGERETGLLKIDAATGNCRFGE